MGALDSRDAIATQAETSQSGLPLVSIIVPAYNEGSILQGSLQEIGRTLQGLAHDFTFEIVVIDDGSADDTAAIAQRGAQQGLPVNLVRHPVNLGLGEALRTGFAHARGDFAIVLDADLSYSTDHIQPLLQTLTSTRAHVVVASPYMKGGKTTKIPLMRYLLSKWANRFLAMFCPHANVHTLTGMVRGYDGEFLRSLNLRSQGVEINTEILYKALLLRGRIVEIPGHLDWTALRDSPTGRSSKFRVVKGILTYVISGFLFRPFMFFIVPGLILGAAATYIIGWILVNVYSVYGAVPPGSFFDDQFSAAVAHVFQDRPHAFFVGGTTALIALQLITLGVLSFQQKRYFEELFHVVSNVRRRIMRVEKHDTE